MGKEVLITINSPQSMPVRQHRGDAGADLTSRVAIMIVPGSTVNVPTGVKIAIPYGKVGLVFSRSGLATKHGIRLANGVGVIDSQYRGEIGVPLYNGGDEPYSIKRYERIAQLVIIDVDLPEFMAVDELPKTERGDGGFGSTGRG